ncbi:MAG: hypothetical protein ACE5LQ_05915 [Candidatus Bipolaricaulia bacterium]
MARLEQEISKEAQDEIEMLIAVGLYKTQSESMKGCLRRLTLRYAGSVEPLQELRKRLDEKLGDKSLSDVIKQLREEEMH